MSKIKIYADESVNVTIVEGLRRRGIEAHTARDTGNLGLSDERQLIYARENKLVILTHDADFLRIAAQWSAEGKEHCGIIYWHQQNFSIGECIRRLKLIADILDAEDMINYIEFL